ncbi:Beta-1,3-galactosyltransferase 5 [Chionoecetes opilio]|uniref:Hexosyltransferase n=1 Tax=Chionoecetes opilio TaxID=41210 RepID=A0A8J5CME5_CHIOP|nr:Beta-1,3-galactosyltransferase 5 [Chionoecetes opilio]KAG0716206.1 Beta-1,3-galactosyltransferase 5 [Chionoecetes opilio]
MAVVFMVRQAKTEEEETILREESERYHDVVQGNYTDSYHMLSYKALSSLIWVTRHCSHVPWTMHADDDVLVDVFLLKKFLDTNDTRDSILCYPWGNSSVRRYGKWCVRHSEYPEDMYPTYCGGGA